MQWRDIVIVYPLIQTAVINDIVTFSCQQKLRIGSLSLLQIKLTNWSKVDSTLEIFSQALLHFNRKERLKVLTKLNILGWLKPSLNSKATERSGLCLYSEPTPTDFLRFAGPNPT